MEKVGNEVKGKLPRQYSLEDPPKDCTENKGRREESFTDILLRYRLGLEAANRSPKTISWYMDILNRYFEFLESIGLIKPIDELGRTELREYVTHLQNTVRWAGKPSSHREEQGRLSPYSIQGHVRAVKALWGWLTREGDLEKNPLAKFPLPKVPKNLVKTISFDQFNALLSKIDRSTSNGARYYCILLILFDTGMRISELTHISLTNIDFAHSHIKIMGKGSKERVVPILPLTRREIRGYVNKVRPNICSEDSPYLFPNRDGDPISVNSVQQFLRRLAKKARLNGVKISPHVFRHSFATAYLANGGNVFYLKEILGHEALVTTQKYAHPQQQDIQKQHARFSPVANLPKHQQSVPQPVGQSFV